MQDELCTAIFKCIHLQLVNDGRMRQDENGINMFETEIEQHPYDPAQCGSGEVESQERDQPALKVAWQGQAHVDDLTGLPLPEGL